MPSASNNNLEHIANELCKLLGLSQRNATRLILSPAPAHPCWCVQAPQPVSARQIGRFSRVKCLHFRGSLPTRAMPSALDSSGGGGETIAQPACPPLQTDPRKAQRGPPRTCRKTHRPSAARNLPGATPDDRCPQLSSEAPGPLPPPARPGAVFAQGSHARENVCRRYDAGPPSNDTPPHRKELENPAPWFEVADPPISKVVVVASPASLLSIRNARLPGKCNEERGGRGCGLTSSTPRRPSRKGKSTRKHANGFFFASSSNVRCCEARGRARCAQALAAAGMWLAIPRH
jgi:hypothetical protein